MTKKLEYVATGTGRSGSVYMARLLTSLGITCGHECVFTRFGAESALEMLNHPERIRTSLVSGDGWLLEGEVVADSSYMAAPYLGEPFLVGTDIIHAVRHPLRVVSSFVRDLGYFKGTMLGTSYEHFIYGQIPDLYRDMSPLERASIFYVRWNEMIEGSHLSGGSRYLRFRVEDPVGRLLDFLRYEFEPGSIFRDRKANTMQAGRPLLTLKEIPAGEAKDALVAMGERYGYEMNSRTKLF